MKTYPTLLEITRGLIAQGWPVLLAFSEARDRLALLHRDNDNSARKTCNDLRDE